MNYTKRNIEKQLNELIQTRPIIYLNGARQVGKSTLCNFLANYADYITFDSPLILSSAKSAPETFINSLASDKLNIIDEVQFAPEIFPYLKIKTDENRLKGNNKQKFLLTGSANLLALPRLSEALVGRMSVLTLFPFSASEYYKTNISIMDRLFNDELKISNYRKTDINEIIINSTYPEIAINSEIDRTKWFDGYLTTILSRDVKSLSDLKNSEAIITLLSVLSMRTGGLINNTQIAKETGIDYRTFEKMLTFAINSFMIFFIRPWAKPNKLNKRFVKSPKLYFTDCNFLLYIMKRSLKSIYDTDKQVYGHIFENFIASELIKYAKLNNIEISHFRTQSGKEADFVLENMSGDIIGLEVKSTESIDKKYISGLLELKELCGENFKKGIVLYSGNDLFPLEDKIWAVPVSYFWGV